MTPCPDEQVINKVADAIAIGGIEAARRVSARACEHIFTEKCPVCLNKCNQRAGTSNKKLEGGPPNIYPSET